MHLPCRCCQKTGNLNKQVFPFSLSSPIIFYLKLVFCLFACCFVVVWVFAVGLWQWQSVEVACYTFNKQIMIFLPHAPLRQSATCKASLTPWQNTSAQSCGVHTPEHRAPPENGRHDMDGGLLTPQGTLARGHSRQGELWFESPQVCVLKVRSPAGGAIGSHRKWYEGSISSK